MCSPLLGWMPLDIVGWLRWRHLILTLSIVQAVVTPMPFPGFLVRDENRAREDHSTSRLSLSRQSATHPKQNHTDTFHLQGQNLAGVTDMELRRAQQ